jgi:16S rRNA (cytosine967-C5)-methyltransferase
MVDKCALAGIAYEQLTIFPFAEPLSPAIDKAAFVLSHLQQPDLFIRIRPGHEKQVLQKLDKAGEAWRQVNDSCIVLSNASKIDTVLQLDKEAVVQDYSSQRVGEFLQLAANNSTALIRNVWDCCAASGGKSILAKDMLGDIHLTVSDVRKSIIVNLEKRFAAAGITQYKSLIRDLAGPASSAGALAKAGFDLIIADAPCSGSGTWGRTPESLSFYREEETNRYQALQKQIVSNAFPLLRKGGCFLYITCSVFEKENEAVAAFIEERFHPRLLRMESLRGYHDKADTMFATLFVKE